MMKIIKPILVIVVIAAIGFLLYKYFLSSKEVTSPLVSSNSGGVLPSDGGVSSADLNNEFLDLLLNMKNIDLDTSIFQEQAFQNLQDFSVTVTQEPSGRSNPFAPIGEEGTAVSQGFSVSTNSPSSVTASSATLSGTVGSGALADERHFEWGTSSVTPLANTTIGVSQNTATGSFSYVLTGLTPNTTYYARAVAKLGTATLYGAVISFKTQASGGN